MRSNLAFAVAFCCLTFCVLAAVSAQNENEGTSSAVAKLINDGLKADLAGDPSVVRQHYDQAYVEGTSFGTWMRKPQLLDTSKNKMNTASITDLKVDVHGDVAIARFHETYDGLVDGQHRSRTIICTQTWNLQGANWMALASHCSQAQ